ncbi:MAG: NAD(P)-dependent oxidoreductase [Myxococcota bacterium]
MARIHLGTLKRALVVENPAPVLDEYLTASGMSVLRLTETPTTEALIEILQKNRIQAIFKRSRTKIPRALVEACPDLLAVQLCCIGDDSVDKQACADNGVMVFNDPVSNGRSVVELVIAHLIALSRRLYETNEATRAGRWEKNNRERYEILGKRLGILGLGNIGRAVARAASALGMEIWFYDTRQVSFELGRELGWTAASSPDALFRNADYVTVHLSANDIHGASNERFLSNELLPQLGADRPDNSPRIFLNLSRGFLHSADDLRNAISAGAVRRAAVDVYPSEPRRGESWANPYAGMPQVAVTPHIGASTQEAQPRIARRVSQTFLSFSQTGALRDCVFRPRMSLNLSSDMVSGNTVLAVVHSTSRGTKRAIGDAIYNAGASNLASAHKDFAELKMAYDLALLDHPLTMEEIEALIAETARVTGEPNAIRSVRQIAIG